MTPPRDGEKGGEVDEWTDARITEAQRVCQYEPFLCRVDHTESLLAAIARRNASLAAKDAEIAKLRAAHCAWHGPYTGERTPCCVHQERLKETPQMPHPSLAELRKEARRVCMPGVVVEGLGPDGVYLKEPGVAGRTTTRVGLLSQLRALPDFEALASGGEGKSDG